MWVSQYNAINALMFLQCRFFSVLCIFFLSVGLMLFPCLIFIVYSNCSNAPKIFGCVVNYFLAVAFLFQSQIS